MHCQQPLVKLVADTMNDRVSFVKVLRALALQAFGDFGNNHFTTLGGL